MWTLLHFPEPTLDTKNIFPEFSSSILFDSLNISKATTKSSCLLFAIINVELMQCTNTASSFCKSCRYWYMLVFAAGHLFSFGYRGWEWYISVIGTCCQDEHRLFFSFRTCIAECFSSNKFNVKLCQNAVDKIIV